MDLQGFLAWSKLQGLAPALQEAGVETVGDLQAYYEDIRALAPEEFRQEMAETFGCKRIEISRLVAALEKHASGGAAEQPQKPRPAAVNATATGAHALHRDPSARTAMIAEEVQPEASNAHVEHEVIVPRTVSPPIQEVAPRPDSHDLCAEFDEPMTAETPWLPAAVVSAETDQPANPPPPYDDAWLATANESVEPARHPSHDFELIASTESADVSAETERADRVDVDVVVDDDHAFAESDGDVVEDASRDVALNEERAVVVEEAVADAPPLEGSDAELELEGELMEDGYDDVRASEGREQPVADTGRDELDAGEDGVIVEPAAQSNEASAVLAAAVAAVVAADDAQTGDAVEDERPSDLRADSQELVEPSAPMFHSAGHEDDYDLQAVSEEFDVPLACTALAPLPLPVSAPDAAELDATEMDGAAASGDGTTTAGPKCNVTSAEYNPAENVVVVSVHVTANDPLEIDEVVANCVVVFDGRAVNARSHELHCSEEQDASEGPWISGSLTFDLGLRPLDAGTELPQLRFEYDGEEISPVLQLTVVVGVEATADGVSPESPRQSSDSILAASVSTEVFEMHGLDHSAELPPAAPLMHSPSLPAPAPSSGSHTFEAAARQALFVADDFETTDGEDDRSSHSSAYTRPSAPSSSAAPMGSPVIAAPAAGGAAGATGFAAMTAGIGASVGSIARYADNMVSYSELPTVEAVYVSGEGAILQDGVAVEAEIVDLDVVGQQEEAGLNVSEIVAPPPPVPASRRLDIPTMDVIARQPKSGPLKKYAKYMKGSWHERYFVLDGRALWYFKTKKDFNRNNEAKRRVLELVPTSSAVRLSTPCTFAVGNRTDSWTLQAANDTDMHEWMNAINAHIHFLYIRMHGVRVGGFGQLLECPQYFTLTMKGKKAMAIRSIPDGKGPRTGGVIQPGEIIEVVQLYPAGAQPQDDEVFFRLADDKGWVFQVTAEGDKVIAPAAGFAFNEEGFYQIHPRCRTPVPLRFGPSFHSQPTGQTLEAGEKFRVCRRWVSGVNEGADFLKLVASSGKEGWVQIFNRPREVVTEAPPQQIVQEITEEEFLGQNGGRDDVPAPPPPQEAALQPARTATV